MSARDNVGIDRLWSEIERRYAELAGSGQLQLRRQAQRRAEFQLRLRSELWRRFVSDPRAHDFEELQRRVAAGELLAARAVQQLLSGLFGADSS